MDQAGQKERVYTRPTVNEEVNLPSNDIEEPQPEANENEPFRVDDSPHYQNLAEILDESILSKIGNDLYDAVEEDERSREDWMFSVAERLRLLGIRTDENGLPYPGASAVFSPMLHKAIIDAYVALAAELLPEEGPARELTEDGAPPEIEQQAVKVENWFNRYLTEIATEFYPDFRAMLWWVIFGGNNFRKVFYDPALKRITSRYIMPQDFIVNYGTRSLDTCYRITEIIKLNAMELWRRQQSGQYRKVDLVPLTEGDEENKVSTAIDRIVGVKKPVYDKKIDYELAEIHTYLDLEDYDYQKDLSAGEKESDKDNIRYLPYIVTIDRKTRKVLGVFKNWDEEDEDRKRLDWYVDYGYMQGPGFYKLGAVQLIGGLADSTTQLLRNTINGLYLANMPGGLYAKGIKLESSNLTVAPTQYVPVDIGGMTSIRDAFMPMPYNEPSPAINDMRVQLEESGSSLMGSIGTKIAEFDPNAAVGTTYAILDALHLVQSTVMRSLRESMGREFKIFFRLFSKYLPDDPYVFGGKEGENSISRSDFVDTITIVPVADPHVTTKMQRQLRALTVLNQAMNAPQLHNMYEVYKRYYESTGIPNVDEILPPPQDVPPLDPISETMNLMTNKPVKAYIWQEHAAHMAVLQPLLDNLDPLISQPAKALYQEHAAFRYLIEMQEAMGIPLPPNLQELPPEQQNQIAMMAAQAVQAIMQQIQKEEPPTPLDPAVVAMEEVKVHDKKIDVQAQTDDKKIELEAFKAQLVYDAKMKEIQARFNQSCKV